MRKIFFHTPLLPLQLSARTQIVNTTANTLSVRNAVRTVRVYIKKKRTKIFLPPPKTRVLTIIPIIRRRRSRAVYRRRATCDSNVDREKLTRHRRERDGGGGGTSPRTEYVAMRPAYQFSDSLSLFLCLSFLVYERRKINANQMQRVHRVSPQYTERKITRDARQTSPIVVSLRVRQRVIITDELRFTVTLCAKKKKPVYGNTE